MSGIVSRELLNQLSILSEFFNYESYCRKAKKEDMNASETRTMCASEPVTGLNSPKHCIVARLC